jgi:pimeloyl-ACP methyl ester carboxylesterase
VKAFLAATLAIILAIGVFAVAAGQGWLNPSESTLRERYAFDNSQFRSIAGRDVHVIDEGEGPAILLIHGSFGSLRMWDDWSKALKGNYRVVRFDRPGMGLTAPSPDARYGREAEMELIGPLLDDLGIDRVVIVATSSGGDAAAGWAALNPERVAGVIFANISAGPMRPRSLDELPFSVRASLKLSNWLGGWQPRALWRGALEYNFFDPAKVTPELVREWTELANRSQGWERNPAPPGYVPFSQAPADLAAIRAPALLLWSADDHDTSLEEHGEPALRLLGSADKALIVIPRCGHMMPIECGSQSVEAAMPFLAGITGTAS